MANNLDIAERFKRYELVSEGHLYRRTPIIIRLDGNAFHAFTRKIWGRTWSADFHQCMANAVMPVMKKISGAKLAYMQSDEVSILLTDYDHLSTEAWFGYDLSKVISISSGMLSAYFNKEMATFLGDRASESVGERKGSYNDTRNPVWFDARAFNVPREDVANYFVWRQMDAIRNSISFFTSQFWSHREMQGKSCRLMLAMCESKGHDWNALPSWRKNGLVIRKGFAIGEDRWVLDHDCPTFTQDFNYIDRYVNCEKDETVETHIDVPDAGTDIETQYDREQPCA